jgi:DGQHR domain-containing protein
MIPTKSQAIKILGISGLCGGREVFLGFAPARTLHRISFADVLDEATGRGYQRRFSKEHSQEFRRYIQLPGSATIPLTFNLRPTAEPRWAVTKLRGGTTRLSVSSDNTPVLSQVDCQHRLGHLADLEISLPFMTFIGLSVEDEMRIFNTINGKAKGLSSSLLDFHEAKLSKDLAYTKPELYIALHLNFG